MVRSIFDTNGIPYFRVVVVQWRQRNVQIKKKRDAREKLLFWLLNLLLFWRPRCRRRRRILKSLIASLETVLIVLNIKEEELDKDFARIEPVCTFKLGLYC